MVDELLALANDLNTEVYFQKSIIGKSYVVEVDDGFYCINLDMNRMNTEEDVRVSLAHEIGHVQSGTLYFNNSTKLYKGSAEYRADYRAAQIVMPIYDLKDCISKGITETYDLAEFFGITEEYVKRILYIYENKGLLKDCIITL